MCRFPFSFALFTIADTINNQIYYLSGGDKVKKLNSTMIVDGFQGSLFENTK